MKKLILLAAFILTATLSAQEAGKNFYYPGLHWSVKIPAGYTKTEINPDDFGDEEKVIFSFEKGETETFEATEEPFDEAEGDYAEAQEMAASLMEDLLGDTAKITSTKETIDGREFYHHEFKIDLYGEIYTMHLFNGYINGMDFCMNIGYGDEAEGAILLKAFRASTFK